MTVNNFRLFAAIPLPHNIRQKLADWSKENCTAFPFQKWAHADDLHITLFFLGDTEERRIPGVRQALAKAASQHGSFLLQLGNTGTFGPPAAPSILWVGVDGDRDSLIRLQRDVSSSIASLGWKQEDRPYKPHITLARRYNGTSTWSNPNRNVSLPFPLTGTEWRCGTIILYKSNLGASPMYEPLAEIPLSLPVHS